MTDSLTSVELRFLLRLRKELGRHDRPLRTGHVELALAVRSASSWEHILASPVFAFSIIATMGALAASFMTGFNSSVLVNAILIFALVTLVGIVYYVAIGLAAPARHVAEAALKIAEAEQEDVRTLATLRGRARRAAEAQLATTSDVWQPPTESPGKTR